MKKVGNYIWSHVADLVFDCFYLANLSEVRAWNRILLSIKSSADFLAQTVRCGLSQCGPSTEPRLLQARLFLADLKLQLFEAYQLGALSDRVHRNLTRRTDALLQAFHHPQVSALFRHGGLTRPG